MEDDKTIQEELEMETDEQEDEDAHEEQPEESIEDLKQRLAEEEARRIKAEEAIKKAKFAEKKKKETITTNTNNTPSDADSDTRIKNLEVAESKRQFGYRNGLSPEAVDYLFKINPNPSSEDLKDPFIRGGLKEIERRNKIKSATLSSSVTSGISTGNKSWASMSKEERAQAYNKRQKRS